MVNVLYFITAVYYKYLYLQRLNFFIVLGHIHIQVNNIIQSTWGMSFYFCSILYEHDGCNKSERDATEVKLLSS